MEQKRSESANSQAPKGSPFNGVVPPVDRQFGKPNGNKQGRGFWKKEDTARYKLEQMLKLDEAELVKIANDKSQPLFERRLARSLLRENEWKTTERMINQVYGYPKQEVQQTNIELKPILPKKEKKK